MENNIKVLIIIIICIIVVFIVGIFIGLNIKKSNEDGKTSNIDNNEKDILDKPKVVSASIIIETENNDVAINSKLLSTYSELINSNAIKRKVLEKYPNAHEVQLKQIDGTNKLKIIYICGEQDEDECVNIVHEYISTFINNINEIYKIGNIRIVESPTVLNQN